MSDTWGAAPNPTPNWASARAAFSAFIGTLEKHQRLVGVHDVDADGLSAGAVWQRCMERLGFADVVRVMPDRERNVWAEGNRARVLAAGPGALFVMDLGSQAVPVAAGVRTCFIDHHQPEGVPPGDVLVSAYAWDSIPTTSLLMWDVCGALADVSDLDWIAAVGVVGDLGEHAPFPLLAEAKKKHTARWLKEATALVNAPRRSSRPDPEAAARALLHYAGPKELALATDADVETLRAAREEVKAAMEEAKKAAPTFSGRVALIRMRSACQVHPLIAQVWRSRLPQYVVVAANDGYLPGRVNFSARSRSGVSVLEFLRAAEIGEGEGSFGHGHDQASGGSLPYARWNDLLRVWGFPESVWAKGG